MSRVSPTEEGVAFLLGCVCIHLVQHQKKRGTWSGAEALDDQLLAQRHEWLYVPLSSVSTGQDFSLFVCRSC